MKKQILNEEFARMQKLAGLITESEYKAKLNENKTAKTLYQMFKDEDLLDDRREYDVEDLMSTYPDLSQEEAKKLEKMLQDPSNLNEKINEVLDDNTIKMVFDEKIQDDYKPLIGTDPIYDGLEKVLNSPELLQKVTEWVNNMLEDEDDEEIEDMTGAYTSDAVDYEIMKAFAPQLAKNLIKVGFTYDKNDDIWTVPEKYSNKTNYKELTSYGIIWDIWNVDYDTSPREKISDYLQDAAE